MNICQNSGVSQKSSETARAKKKKSTPMTAPSVTRAGVKSKRPAARLTDSTQDPKRLLRQGEHREFAKESAWKRV